MKKFKLCLVKENKAYFTSDLTKTWGDDWGDAYYEVNAGEPYDDEVVIKSLYFELPHFYQTPANQYPTKEMSVQKIHETKTPWIEYEDIQLITGVDIQTFIEQIEKMDGTVFLEKQKGGEATR